jgi:hypothetical protein
MQFIDGIQHQCGALPQLVREFGSAQARDAYVGRFAACLVGQKRRCRNGFPLTRKPDSRRIQAVLFQNAIQYGPRQQLRELSLGSCNVLEGLPPARLQEGLFIEWCEKPGEVTGRLFRKAQMISDKEELILTIRVAAVVSCIALVCQVRIGFVGVRGIVVTGIAVRAIGLIVIALGGITVPDTFQGLGAQEKAGFRGLGISIHRIIHRSPP